VHSTPRADLTYGDGSNAVTTARAARRLLMPAAFPREPWSTGSGPCSRRA